MDSSTFVKNVTILQFSLGRQYIEWLKPKVVDAPPCVSTVTGKLSFWLLSALETKVRGQKNAIDLQLTAERGQHDRRFCFIP